MNSCPEIVAANVARPHPAWRALVFVAVPLASFLSFSVQPLIGKFLVPWHGGSASTWIGAMLFFQAALVLGYSWACWLGSRSPALQMRATIGLAAVAALATLLPPPRLLGTAGMGEVLLSLSVAMLPAMVLLFSTGLLLQAWIRRFQTRVPYYLYSISNVGSLGALVLYPVWLEPNVGLGIQAAVWRWLLVGLAILLVILALGLRKTAEAEAPLAERDEETISSGRKFAWFGLSALTCICMLGATRHLSAEIGSNPLSWIVPLGIYLASFSLVFSGWWRDGASVVCVALLGVSLSGFVLLKGITATPISGWAAAWLVAIVAAGCCFGNGLLYSLRPRRDFLQYYLVIGVGGMVGGIFSSLSAPNIFPRDFEFLGAATFLLATGIVHVIRAPSRLRIVVAAVVVMAPVAGAIWLQQRAETSQFRRVHHFRNLYGHIHVVQTPHNVLLRNETTSHGMQVILPESARRRPTLYYIESSGVGRTLERLQAAKPSLAVGVIGVGAGTLAAYARPGDSFTFWDLDPKVIWVAQTAFSFLRDAPGRITVVEDDGRKGLEKSAENFDLIVVDAFSGDSIPMHLLTVEAFETYLAHLSGPDGLLLIHASNRYVEIFPVIAANAQSIGWEALRVHTTVSRGSEHRDSEPTATSYIVLHRPEQREVIDGWFPKEEDDGRVKRQLMRIGTDDPRLVRWTDDRSSILDVLALRRYLGNRE